MNDCVFCKITAGEIPAHKVYEDDLVVAFLDINPWTTGHTLVVPKSHYKNMLETPDELVAKVSVLAKDLASNFKAPLGAEGFYFIAAGVDVDHFHMHIIPRHENADIEFTATNRPANSNLEEVAAKLRND